MLANEAESKRKELSKPFSAFAANIKVLGDKAKEPVEESKTKLKELLLDFYHKLQEIDDEEIQKSLTSVYHKWCFSVENPLLVPFQFYSLDEKKIRQFINNEKDQSENCRCKNLAGTGNPQPLTKFLDENFQPNKKKQQISTFFFYRIKTFKSVIFFYNKDIKL